MRILAIIADFTPASSPEADQMRRMCRELVARGFQIDVLTKAVELAPGLRRTLATAAELEALRRHERFRRLIEA